MSTVTLDLGPENRAAAWEPHTLLELWRSQREKKRRREKASPVTTVRPPTWTERESALRPGQDDWPKGCRIFVLFPASLMFF